jgi:hypothetical protein
MGAQANVQPPPSHSAPTECHLVFGKSLKMQALRHVLRTLEMRVAEPVDYADGSGELRIAFDGCDAEACFEKAAFVRTHSSASAKILQFPIGRVPEIAGLFVRAPVLKAYQGTIMDPDVEIFADCWRSHRLRRFLERDGPDSINEFLTEPITTNAAQLVNYAGLPHERVVAETYGNLMGMLEAKIEGWLGVKSQGDTMRLKELLTAWSKAKAPRRGLTPPGPLYNFCGYLRDLDEREKFGATVAKLSETVMSHAAASWREALFHLQ